MVSGAYRADKDGVQGASGGGFGLRLERQEIGQGMSP